MLGIEVLGAHGSASSTEHCCSFKLGKHILVDAGHVVVPLGDDCANIEHVLLTHAHFDHIRDLPFMVETYFMQRSKPLKIYGLSQTLQAVKMHMFNDVIWPAFQNIKHPVYDKNCIEFIEIETKRPFYLQDIEFEAFSTNHVEGACGFIIRHENKACILSSDTYLSEDLTEAITTTENLTSLFIEVSFPSYMSGLAEVSRHLTPKTLQQQLSAIEKPIDVYLFHLKPCYEKQIKEEIQALFKGSLPYRIAGFLDSDQVVRVFTEQTALIENANHLHNSSQQQLASLLKISQALSGEYNPNQLLDLILDEAMKFTGADAGTLYHFNKDKQELEFSVVRNNELGIYLRDTAGELNWPNLSLYRDGKANTSMVAVVCALNKAPLLINDVYRNTEFDFSGTREFDQTTGYRSHSMLVVPLLAQDNELLGVLQLINKIDTDGDFVAFSVEEQANAMALASQAALSLSNAILVQQMEELFEAFATAIIVAFEEKCSFTGLHIMQVAELAQLISQAINEDQSVYGDVSYSAEILHTIKIAALVHDIGKIATPEAVLHKATKLQKNIDRIELIGLRFQLAKQSVLIESMEKLSGQPFSIDEVRKQQTAKLALLDEDFDFLVQMNSGEESLLEENAQRIRAIAERYYFLHSDKVDSKFALVDDDELMNLCINRGTLNEAERKRIMDHARLSLDMLKTLPFPEKYGRIIDIAANHHEKLNGKGYPRGLTVAELTLEDEIMVLADLYEALSSNARPYKKPMTIKQVSHILSDMVNRGEIDGQLVRFFFEKGIYKRYNHRLSESQITDFELTIDNSLQTGSQFH
ncbi:HD domain-containing phosphohydrolase [Thiomicrorhabdus sediminis]|uniref:GAF domain-containing protein n=1 Tax=Thiomicrorhabdus sediminis TaxID=2580412 RepID=A0A4P9K5T4_9GAMM|nr:HD domain-containing phosphohydrolase [Thiomicrorhabdus sediminis]QCU90339.1 GAF domain-containing protein [Thiomicrorhabdus sediminis]